MYGLALPTIVLKAWEKLRLSQENKFIPEAIVYYREKSDKYLKKDFNTAKI